MISVLWIRHYLLGAGVVGKRVISITLKIIPPTLLCILTADTREFHNTKYNVYLRSTPISNFYLLLLMNETGPDHRA